MCLIPHSGTLSESIAIGHVYISLFCKANAIQSASCLPCTRWQTMTEHGSLDLKHKPDWDSSVLCTWTSRLAAMRLKPSEQVTKSSSSVHTYEVC